jgi:hypothetical protein
MFQLFRAPFVAVGRQDVSDSMGSNRTAGAQAYRANPASDIQTSGAQVGADRAPVHCDVFERVQTPVCL